MGLNTGISEGIGGKAKVKVNVTKRFGETFVLDNIKFDVRENEFLCLVGPTGCGKTILCRIIGGLIQPSVGEVTIDGKPVNNRTLNISFVFQEPSCLPWLTVKENIRVGLEIKGITGSEAEERIKEVMDVVALTGFEKYYPSQISGGMKQRVAIARAFATDPDLLLMDEPFAHLDAQTRSYMQLEIQRIWGKLKKTVIFATNNIEEAVQLAERVVILSRLPARIIGEVPVDLSGEQRDVTSQPFLAMRKQVSGLCEALLI
jgi:ABC-type nitrate/sulfonate/bicarbonate transport system ATPase subunit